MGRPLQRLGGATPSLAPPLSSFSPEASQRLCRKSTADRPPALVRSRISPGLREDDYCRLFECLRERSPFYAAFGNCPGSWTNELPGVSEECQWHPIGAGCVRGGTEEGILELVVAGRVSEPRCPLRGKSGSGPSRAGTLLGPCRAEGLSSGVSRHPLRVRDHSSVHDHDGGPVVRMADAPSKYLAPLLRGRG